MLPKPNASADIRIMIPDESKWNAIDHTWVIPQTGKLAISPSHEVGEEGFANNKETWKRTIVHELGEGCNIKDRGFGLGIVSDTEIEIYILLYDKANRIRREIKLSNTEGKALAEFDNIQLVIGSREYTKTIGAFFSES